MAQQITEILQDWKNGDKSAVDRLFPLVYENLRQEARKHLDNERKDHTIQPTALVHRAYLRMAELNEIEWKDRIHFFAVSSTMMRRTLVDHARALRAKKRGGSNRKKSLSDASIKVLQRASELINLDEALNRLNEIDQRKCQIVEMKYFGGMTQTEIAEALDIAEKTVQRDWQFSKLWLFRDFSP